jgi:hypothetical protein
MTHLLTKQGAETEVAEKLDHRGQAPLAGERRTRRIQVDLGAANRADRPAFVLCLLIERVTPQADAFSV